MIALILLSIVALLFVLVPYVRGGREAVTEAPDISVYKAQLFELENDISRGLVDEDEGKRTRTEIERRLLKAANLQSPEISMKSFNNIHMAFLVIIVMISGGVYAVLGTPGMPDFPRPENIITPENEEQAKLLAEIEGNIEKVRDRLAVAPDEVQGWAYLAHQLLNLGKFQEAAEALYQAHLLEPDRFDYQLMYAESLIMASSEQVTPAAKVILNKAAKMDPNHPGPKYYLGLAEYQAGEVEIAYESWKSIREELTDDDPMKRLVDVWINRAEVTLGLADPLPEGRAPSISREQAEIIQNMSEDEQTELIQQMVMQLAAKQEENPSNIQGWIQLSRSYMVLGRKEDAIAAMQSAVDNAPEDQKADLQKEVEKLTNLQ